MFFPVKKTSQVKPCKGLKCSTRSMNIEYWVALYNAIQNTNSQPFMVQIDQDHFQAYYQIQNLQTKYIVYFLPSSLFE